MLLKWTQNSTNNKNQPSKNGGTNRNWIHPVDALQKGHIAYLVFGQHRDGSAQRHRCCQEGDLQAEIQSTIEKERRHENPQDRTHHKYRWRGDTGTKNKNDAQTDYASVSVA